MLLRIGTANLFSVGSGNFLSGIVAAGTTTVDIFSIAICVRTNVESHCHPEIAMYTCEATDIVDEGADDGGEDRRGSAGIGRFALHGFKLV